MVFEGYSTPMDRNKDIGQRYVEFMNEIEFQEKLCRERSRQLDKTIENFVNELDRLGMIR
jgi:hypothetical protein